MRATEYSIAREFKDVVFEDVVFDNNRFATLLSIVFIVTSMPDLLLSNTTSSNTTSLNSRASLYLIQRRWEVEWKGSKGSVELWK